MKAIKSTRLAQRTVLFLLLNTLGTPGAYAANPATTLPKVLKNPNPRVLDTPPEPLAKFSAQEQESTAAPQGYDSVPEAYRDAIADRLKVTAELIRLGRAYDYRTKTTAQLQEILKSLQLSGQLSGASQQPLAPPVLNSIESESSPEEP